MLWTRDAGLIDYVGFGVFLLLRFFFGLGGLEVEIPYGFIAAQRSLEVNIFSTALSTLSGFCFSRF